MLRGVEQGNPRADSDEDTGMKVSGYLLKHKGEMECRSGEARVGCRKPGAEAEAGGSGVGTG